MQPPPDSSTRMLTKLSQSVRGQSLLIDHQCWNAGGEKGKSNRAKAGAVICLHVILSSPLPTAIFVL